MDLIAGQGALLGASLSAPVSIPKLISNDSKALSLYEDSSHPGDPPGEGRPVGLCKSTVQILMIPGQTEDGDSHLSFPTCPEDQLETTWTCRAGKDCKLHLAQAFYVG